MRELLAFLLISVSAAAGAAEFMSADMPAPHPIARADDSAWTVFRFALWEGLAFPDAKNLYGVGLNLPYCKSRDVEGLEIGLVNGRREGYCVGIGAFADYTLERAAVIQLSGFSASAADADGVQLSGLTAYSAKSADGIQLGGLAARAKEMDGIQFAGLWSCADVDIGLQAAGLMAVSSAAEGMQLAAVSLLGRSIFTVDVPGLKSRCVQFAVFNYADLSEEILVQTKQSMGWASQFGVVNYSNHAGGFQIGLVNFKSDGFCFCFPFVNF